MEEFQAFYDAAFPRLDAAMEAIDRYELDALPDDASARCRPVLTRQRVVPGRGVAPAAGARQRRRQPRRRRRTGRVTARPWRRPGRCGQHGHEGGAEHRRRGQARQHGQHPGVQPRGRATPSWSTTTGVLPARPRTTHVRTVGELARRATVVVLSLPDGAASDVVAARSSRCPNAVPRWSSTRPPSGCAARGIAVLLAGDGVAYLDAPVSGGVAGAGEDAGGDVRRERRRLPARNPCSPASPIATTAWATSPAWARR